MSDKSYRFWKCSCQTNNWHLSHKYESGRYGLRLRSSSTFCTELKCKLCGTLEVAAVEYCISRPYNFSDEDTNLVPYYTPNDVTNNLLKSAHPFNSHALTGMDSICQVDPDSGKLSFDLSYFDYRISSSSTRVVYGVPLLTIMFDTNFYSKRVIRNFNIMDLIPDDTFPLFRFLYKRICKDIAEDIAQIRTALGLSISSSNDLDDFIAAIINSIYFFDYIQYPYWVCGDCNTTQYRIPGYVSVCDCSKLAKLTHSAVNNNLPFIESYDKLVDIPDRNTANLKNALVFDNFILRSH